MRKGFDGLFGIARDRLGIDPLSGHLFVFCNGRRMCDRGPARVSDRLVH
jgi:IS66 Orf2 like protein